MSNSTPRRVTVDAVVSPEGSLEVLSQSEINRLRDSSQGGLHGLLQRCALAVLNCGGQVDDSRQVLQQYPDFDVEVLQQERGIKLALKAAPATAFVDGEMIRGIREHLFAVVRDLVYVSNEIEYSRRFDLGSGPGISDAVFHVLRNAGVLKAGTEPALVVCWGGHAISRHEYDYTKEVGHELGLRDLDICTGCGPGAMKGPMKGATIGHAKQRQPGGRYLGITEPGIIAAEPPNPIVNQLVIMPDIEKRLEAFVRLGHGFIIFPGGVGTTEELLYLLGILLNPANADLPFPLVLTGPASSTDYFRRIDRFIVQTLGEAAASRYRILVDDPVAVAREIKKGIAEVGEFRRQRNDAYHFNWLLNIDPAFQQPFAVTHDNMASLSLRAEQPAHVLAANLRRAFSGIVTGNVKDVGLQAIEEHGPFQMRGDQRVMSLMDELLESFVQEGRMRLPGAAYVPCYRLTA